MLAKNLAAWPSTAELFGKLDKLPPRPGPGERGTQASDPHRLEWAGNTLRCKACLVRFKSAASAAKQHCNGYPAGLARVIQQPQGHRLCGAWTLDGERWVVWCKCCGAFVESAPKLLTKPCSGRLGKFGRTALARLCRGEHPVTMQPMAIPKALDVG
eukprot:10812680-Karenia_brevis.AAC.1